MLNLERVNGRIVNRVLPNVTMPVTLLGGQYHLFSATGLGVKALVDRAGNVVFRWGKNATDEVCPGAVTDARYQYWSTWNELFNNVAANGCNLLRVFLTNGSAMSNGKPTDIFPYRRAANGKLDVRSAIEAPPNVDAYNTSYFNILKDFALHADERDIALQVCLFNYFDLDGADDDPNLYYQGWRQSIWNPAATTDPAWGAAWLVNVQNGDGKSRNAYFMDTGKTNLLLVQQRFVARVAKALQGRGNIIYEIMNEPRGTTNESMARWSSKAVSWIEGAAGQQRLISVNASRGTDSKPALDFDVDTWKSVYPPIPNYDAVDLISYHGLTGYSEAVLDTCGHSISMPFVDKPSVTARITAHQGNHGSKAIVFSTDGVHQLPHRFNNLDAPGTPPIEMGRRDGQITTLLPNGTTADQNSQRRLSDLDNWATWCLSRALKPEAAVGTMHFQNLSSFLSSFQEIKKARSEAAGS
jgi:hypothetical protein